MFTITIKTESESDVNAIKAALEESAEEGVLVEPFEVTVDED